MGVEGGGRGRPPLPVQIAGRYRTVQDADDVRLMSQMVPPRLRQAEGEGESIRARKAVASVTEFCVFF